MKRIIAAIIVLSALCVFLWACGEDGSLADSNTATPATTSAPAKNTTTVAQTEPVPTETTTSCEAKYTRLSQDPLTELIPDENYGYILPYCAGLAHEDFCGESYGYYGFMDAQGKILVDPVYQYIDDLRPEDGYGFAPCVWLMKQGEITDFDMTGFHYYLNNEKCGLATADGSTVIDLVYDDIEVLGNHIFAKKYFDESYETYDVDIYNFNCERIGSLTNLNVRILGFREDILRVEKEFKPYYMDLSGEIFAGPFYAAEDFSCGYGLVEVETSFGTEYTYVDKEGKRLSDGWTVSVEGGDPIHITGFAEAESFVGGVASVRVDHSWEQYSVLTTENKFLFDFRIFNRFICEEDYILNNALGSTEVYDHKGELLWSLPEHELIPVSGDGTYLYDSYENKIYNWKTGTVTEGFEGACETALPWPYYEDFPYPLFEGNAQIWADRELNLLARMGEFATLRRDPLSGEYYFVDEGDGTCTLIFSNTKLDMSETTTDRNVQLYGGLILCEDEDAFRCYTRDMELVLCYPYSDFTPSAE